MKIVTITDDGDDDDCKSDENDEVCHDDDELMMTTMVVITWNIMIFKTFKSLLFCCDKLFGFFNWRHHGLIF